MDSLMETDWQQAWRERSKKNFEVKDCAYWDGRAKEYNKHAGKSAYARTFIAYLNLEYKQSVLDMGCGPGTIAIPLAKAGHTVIAADFSPEMRKTTGEQAEAEGLKDFRVVALDWNDNWEDAGIMPKSIDIALASRSTMAPDLVEAFMRLDRTARNKVAISMRTEFTPRGHLQRGSVSTTEKPYIPDYIFGMNVLFQMGASPELRYIDTKLGNGGQMEGKLVRWAYISWDPISSP